MSWPARFGAGNSRTPPVTNSSLPRADRVDGAAAASNSALTGVQMIGIALIGCGRIGQMHARNLAQHPRARVVSVYDVAPESARQIATELNVKAAHSVEQILSDGAVQAVLIASSTATHVPLIGAAVRAGKAVLCEKPIDLDLERVESCWREIAPQRPVVMIGFNRRFDPSFRALRERLQSGE